MKHYTLEELQEIRHNLEIQFGILGGAVGNLAVELLLGIPLITSTKRLLSKVATLENVQ